MNRSEQTYFSLVFIFLLAWSGAFLSGCSTDPYADVESSIATYDYAKTLELLTAPELKELDASRFYRTRALARFVEGKMADGFADIDSAELLIDHPAKPRYNTAKIMYDASVVLLRDKNNVEQVIALLDSALARDPGLLEDILKDIWYRGIEYLDKPGDAGFRLFDFSFRYDGHVLGRLRGYNRTLANRYDEIKAVREVLQNWDGACRKYQNVWQKQPQNFLDLRPFIDSSRQDTSRVGWTLLMKDMDGQTHIGARAGRKVRGDVLSKTETWLP